MSKPRPKNSQEYRKELADQFANILETEGLDWKRGWQTIGNASNPYNGITGRPYNGVNHLALGMMAMINNYDDPRWVTFTQIADKKHIYHPNQKWHLHKDPVSMYVEYWFPWDTVNHKSLTWEEKDRLVHSGEREADEFETKPHYTLVYPAAEVDGMPPLHLEPRPERNAAEMVNMLSKGMGIPISYDGHGQAFYRPSDDSIHLPNPSAFESDYDLNSTALHELAHATGHESRLNREQGGGFGSELYAREELVAEMTSAFMGVGLDTQATPTQVNNHKAYLQGWIKSIREKPNVLAHAIVDAQKATDYLDKVIDRQQERAELGLPDLAEPEPVPPMNSTAVISTQILADAPIDDPIMLRREAERLILKYVQEENPDDEITASKLFADTSHIELVVGTIVASEAERMEEILGDVYDNSEINVSIYADIDNNRIETYLGGRASEILSSVRQFDDLSDFVQNGLSNLSTDDLLTVSQDAIQRYVNFIYVTDFRDLDKQEQSHDADRNENTLDNIIRIIDRITTDERDENADISDPSHVFLAETYSDDGSMTIRSYVDLENYSIDYHIMPDDPRFSDHEIVVSRSFDSFDDLALELNGFHGDDIDALADELHGTITPDMIQNALDRGLMTINELEDGGSNCYISDITYGLTFRETSVTDLTVEHIAEGYESLLDNAQDALDYAIIGDFLKRNANEPLISEQQKESQEEPNMPDRDNDFSHDINTIRSFDDPDIENGYLTFVRATFRNEDGEMVKGIAARREYPFADGEMNFDFGILQDAELPDNNYEAAELWYDMEQELSGTLINSIQFATGETNLDQFMFGTDIINLIENGQVVEPASNENTVSENTMPNYNDDDFLMPDIEGADPVTEPVDGNLINRSINVINDYLRQNGYEPISSDEVNENSQIVVANDIIGDQHIQARTVVDLAEYSINQYFGTDTEFGTRIPFGSLKRLTEALEAGILERDEIRNYDDEEIQYYLEHRFDSGNSFTAERLADIHTLAYDIDAYEQLIDPERYAGHNYNTEQHIADLENGLREGRTDGEAFADINGDFWAGAESLKERINDEKQKRIDDVFSELGYQRVQYQYVDENGEEIDDGTITYEMEENGRTTTYEFNNLAEAERQLGRTINELSSIDPRLANRLNEILHPGDVKIENIDQNVTRSENPSIQDTANTNDENHIDLMSQEYNDIRSIVNAIIHDDARGGYGADADFSDPSNVLLSDINVVDMDNLNIRTTVNFNENQIIRSVGWSDPNSGDLPPVGQLVPIVEQFDSLEDLTIALQNYTAMDLSSLNTWITENPSPYISVAVESRNTNVPINEMTEPDTERPTVDISELNSTDATIRVWAYDMAEFEQETGWANINHQLDYMAVVRSGNTDEIVNELQNIMEDDVNRNGMDAYTVGSVYSRASVMLTRLNAINRQVSLEREAEQAEVSLGDIIHQWAVDADDLFSNYDIEDYNNGVSTPDDNIKNTEDNLSSGETEGYRQWLEDIQAIEIQDDPTAPQRESSFYSLAGDLLERLNDIENDIEQRMQNINEPNIEEAANNNYEDVDIPEVISAMEAAGFIYDNIDSDEGYLVFNGEYNNMTFGDWAGAAEWLDGVVFDDPEVSDRVEQIMHPERFGDDNPEQSSPQEIEVNEEDHIQEIQAMSAAGWIYDPENSTDDNIQFHGDAGDGGFNNWNEVNEWLANNIFEENNVSERINNIMENGPDTSDIPEKPPWACVYQNLYTGELMNEPMMRIQFRNEYDGEDDTSVVTIDDIYQEIGANRMPYIARAEANPELNGEEAAVVLWENHPTGMEQLEVLYRGTRRDCEDYALQINAEYITPSDLRKTYIDQLHEAEDLDTDTYAVYQLKDDVDASQFRFLSADQINRMGYVPNQNDYNLAYFDLTQEGETDTPEGVYQALQLEHPTDYTGYSPSLSDVIVIHQGGEDTAYLVDNRGFQEIPEFLMAQDQALENEQEFQNGSHDFYVKTAPNNGDLSDGNAPWARYSTLEEALDAYDQVPLDTNKELGVIYDENGYGYRDERPLIQRKTGVETITDTGYDYDAVIAYIQDASKRADKINGTYYVIQGVDTSYTPYHFEAYDSLEEAQAAYRDLPTHFDKDLGQFMTSNNGRDFYQTPLIQNRNGIEELTPEGENRTEMWDLLQDQPQPVAWSIPNHPDLVMVQAETGYDYALYGYDENDIYSQITGQAGVITIGNLEDARDTIIQQLGGDPTLARAIDANDVISRAEPPIQETKLPYVDNEQQGSIPMPEMRYYYPELGLDGTANDLFTQARNGYIDNPEALRRIQQILTNPYENNSTDAQYVGFLIESAEADIDELGYNMGSIKLDVYNMGHSEEIPFENGMTLQVINDRFDYGLVSDDDPVMISITDENGNTGSTNITLDEFYNMSEHDFDQQIVGSILAYQMQDPETSNDLDSPNRNSDPPSNDISGDNSTDNNSHDDDNDSPTFPNGVSDHGFYVRSEKPNHPAQTATLTYYDTVAEALNAYEKIPQYETVKSMGAYKNNGHKITYETPFVESRNGKENISIQGQDFLDIAQYAQRSYYQHKRINDTLNSVINKYYVRHDTTDEDNPVTVDRYDTLEEAIAGYNVIPNYIDKDLGIFELAENNQQAKRVSYVRNRNGVESLTDAGFEIKKMIDMVDEHEAPIAWEMVDKKHLIMEPKIDENGCIYNYALYDNNYRLCKDENGNDIIGTVAIGSMDDARSSVLDRLNLSAYHSTAENVEKLQDRIKEVAAEEEEKIKTKYRSDSRTFNQRDSQSGLVTAQMTFIPCQSSRIIGDDLDKDAVFMSYVTKNGRSAQCLFLGYGVPQTEEEMRNILANGKRIDTINNRNLEHVRFDDGTSPSNYIFGYDFEHEKDEKNGWESKWTERPELDSVVQKFQSKINVDDGYIMNIAIKYEDDGYHNHYMYNDTTGKGAAGSGPFRTYEEAKQDVIAHHPDAWEISNKHNCEYGAEKIYDNSSGKGENITNLNVKQPTQEQIQKETSKQNELRWNMACANAIDEAIDENYDYDNALLNTKTAQSLINTYGLDRVKYILSNSIQCVDWDKRYSLENHDWANKVMVSDINRDSYRLTSNPDLINVFVNQIKKIENELNAPIQEMSIEDKIKIGIATPEERKQYRESQQKNNNEERPLSTKQTETINNPSTKTEETSEKTEIDPDEPTGWTFSGGLAAPDGKYMTIKFDAQPDKKVLKDIKKAGFGWDNENKRWRAPLSESAYQKLDNVKAVRPTDGLLPSEHYGRINDNGQIRLTSIEDDLIHKPVSVVHR